MYNNNEIIDVKVNGISISQKSSDIPSIRYNNQVKESSNEVNQLISHMNIIIMH